MVQSVVCQYDVCTNTHTNRINEKGKQNTGKAENINQVTAELKEYNVKHHLGIVCSHNVRCRRYRVKDKVDTGPKQVLRDITTTLSMCVHVLSVHFP